MSTNKSISVSVLILILLVPVLLAAIDTDDYVSIANKYIRVYVQKDTGRFLVKTVRGNLDNSADDNRFMLYDDTPPTTYTSIAIDNGADVYKFGSSDGSFVTKPKVDNGKIVCVWDVDECRITQTISFVNSPVSTRLNSIKVVYKIENKDDEKKIVGVRIMYDTPFDGEPYFIPGYGKVDDEKEFKDDKIPQYWYSFDDLDAPKLRTMGTLWGKGITKPQRVVFASWKKLEDKPWKYETDEGSTFKRSWFGSRDSAVALYYHSQTLSPGDSRTITSVYGLYDIKQFTGKVWSILMGGSKHTDNIAPFAVTADIKNISKSDVTNCYVILKVPHGVKVLSSVNGSIGATHIRYKKLEEGDQKRLTWNLLAENIKGQHQYSITVSGMIGKKLYTARMQRSFYVTHVPKIKKQPIIRARTNAPFYFTRRVFIYRSAQEKFVKPKFLIKKPHVAKTKIVRVVQKKTHIVRTNMVIKKQIKSPPIKKVYIKKRVEGRSTKKDK